MYRIWCRYIPTAKRADGGTKKGKPRQRRAGAWVVVFTTAFEEVNGRPFIRDHFTGALGVLSTRDRRPGTRVSPRQLVAEMLERRRIARQLMRAHAAQAGA